MLDIHHLPARLRQAARAIAGAGAHAGGPAPLPYRPEIDGLRAVAVLPVILFHADLGPFSGGYIGVDVFFVISGYLITAIIIGDLAQGRFSLRRFYERRARRILPALFFVLACSVPAAWLWMLPSEFRDFSQTLIAVSLFASNLLFWRQAGYFAPDADENPLLHTWSLAVEEQFYVAFPLVLLLAWRAGRTPTAGLVAALSLGSLLIAEWGWRNAPDANFYLLPSRAWELGVGALCALALHLRAPGARTGLSALGLGLIVLSAMVYDAQTPFPSVYALAPVIGAALVILYGGAGTLAARLLSGRLMVGIGLVSYSAYLWHQPLLAFARLRTPTHPPDTLMAALVVATLGLAWLSWRYVERPFRQGRGGLLATPRSVLVTACAATAVVVAFGLAGHLSDGRDAIWRAANPQQAHALDLITTARAGDDMRLDDGECRFSAPDLAPAVVARLAECHARHGPGTAILGDSHANDLHFGLYREADAGFLFGLTRGRCNYHAPQRDCANDAFAQLVVSRPALFDTVIYHQAGYHLLRREPGVSTRRVLGRLPVDGAIDPARFTIESAAIEKVARFLDTMAGAARVIWMGPRIEPHIGARYIIQNGCTHSYTLRPGLAGLFHDLDTAIAGAMQDRPSSYMSLIKAVELRMPGDFIDCDTLYWRDGDHWSLAGASRFVSRLRAAGLPP